MDAQPDSQAPVTSVSVEVTSKPQTSTFIKSIRVFLLALIVIGIGLLCTINLWVPKVVSMLLGSQKVLVPNSAQITTPGGMASSSCAKFLNPPDKEGGDQLALPIECKFDIGTDLAGWTLKVMWDQNSQPEVQISNAEGKLVQTITISDPAALNTNYFTDGDVNLAYDVNFDGYKDLRTLNALTASNIVYDYWLFNPKTGMFEKDRDLSKLFNPSFDQTARTITTVASYSADSYQRTGFKFNGTTYDVASSSSNVVPATAL